ncbi:class I SAM-dependent methyltransferase [Pseudomonas protegens]|uniref:class I SAM-dependent methyltransferase n=1 Tax=Pseudomonas protegens TaxID=380021 RepID=UPI0015E18FFF|nr:class I SAM-dependent methyltransferase [Pseudomonas protegens]
MTQDIRLYSSSQVWDQPMQAGQRNLLKAIQDFWPNDIGSVLDVGCGDGKLTSELVGLGVDTIVGLDSSEEALSRLAVQGVKGDARHLPFADGAFDLVMSTDALEHMPDAEEEAAWSELFRVAGKVVMVAVPFREELLDATTRCTECGNCYHVNWHQRSYDHADLHRRTPPGWQVRSTILTGEPWSAMLPPETHLRRLALHEWSGWEAAICPVCGSRGHQAIVPAALPPLFAEALGADLYKALGDYRMCRSHSEVLVVFQRQISAPVPLRVTQARHHSQLATCIDFERQRSGVDLHPYSQVAQHVLSSEGHWRLQFPLYEPTPALEVRRVPGSLGPLHLLLEDACGILLNGCVLSDGQERAVLPLPRPPASGYYGVLASCAPEEPFASIKLGHGPEVVWAQVPDNEDCAYCEFEHMGLPLFVQITKPTWLDPAALEQPMPPINPTPAAVLSQVLARADQSDGQIQEQYSSHSTELNHLLAQIKNLAEVPPGVCVRTQFDENLNKTEIENRKLDNRTLEAHQEQIEIRPFKLITNLEAEIQRLQSELHTCQGQLKKLSQHLENRLGAATRKALKCLVGKFRS